MSASTWIVLVDFNGLEDTRKCLASLAAMTEPAEVVVIDNASLQEVAPALGAEFPRAHFVRNRVNGGWAGGNNLGISYALARGAQIVILLNNDTVVSLDFVARMERAAAAHPQFGVFGPVIYFMDEPGEVMTDGCVFNRPERRGFFQRLTVPVAPAEPPALTQADIVNGCCMLIRREVFERIGLVDERFFLIHEESDFCLRARRAGFLCGILSEGHVWHKGSSSFKRSGRGWQRYYDARNLLLLLRKHQATHVAGRSPWKSRLEYARYVYSRYAIEREETQPEAAEAVLCGLHDALLGQWGPYDARRSRPALVLLRIIFDFWRGRSRLAR